MLCRAYGAETIGDSWQDVGRSSVVEAYRQGWLNETALSAPRSPMCRSVLVESAFAAADVPVYLSFFENNSLYHDPRSSPLVNLRRILNDIGARHDITEYPLRLESATRKNVHVSLYPVDETIFLVYDNNTRLVRSFGQAKCNSCIG